MQQYITLIIQGATIIGIIFTVYLYFRKPQERSDIQDAVFDVKFNSLEKLVTNLRDNHLHTLETKLNTYIAEQQVHREAMIRQMTRIETLLEERLKK